MEMTICANCKFFIKNGPIWYDQYCGASERRKVIDPVTGEEGYAGKNDFGTAYVSDQQFDFARDVNHGSCVLYERR